MKPQKHHFLLLLLTALLILGTMAGCSGDKPQDSDTTTSDPVPVKEEAHIASADLSDYVIINPQNADASVIDASIRLRAALEETYGCKMTVADDEYRFFAKDKTVKPREILIGCTNREETAAFLKTISYGESGTALIGEKLVICGSTEELTVQTVDSLIGMLRAGDVFYSNQSDKILSSPDRVEKKEYTIAGVPLSDFKIVHLNSETYTEADRLYHEIGKATGICLPVVRTGILDADNPIPAILSGSAEKVSKSLANLAEFGFAEYGYNIKLLGNAPQIIPDGESQYSARLAGSEFVKNLLEGAEMKADTAVKKCSLENTEDVTPVQKDHPVDGVKLAGGDLSAYRIVYAEDEIGKAKFAASELAAYLEKATGILIPVVTDDTQDGEDKEIVVGVTNRDTDAVTSRRAALVNDGIMYFMEGNRLFIGSHTDAGQIYAVYHFLEEKIGCRFYANDFEAIRPSGIVEIPQGLDYSYSSPLFYRYTEWGMNSAQYRKLGINHGEDTMYEIVGFCHTLGALSETGAGGVTPNPCLCDEEIYQTVLKNVRARIEATPNCRVISVTQNDTYERCHCEKCTAMEEAENPSGLMLTFINRLAEDIEKDYPDVKILTFAYQYTRKPPKTIKARDNVLIWLCSIECCFNHTLNDPKCELNKAFAKDIKEWANYCKQMYIWDYTTDYGRFTYTFPNLKVLRENAAFFVDQKASGVYEEGGYQQLENGEFSRLRSWLLGHLLWNPYMTEEEYDRLMDEFLEDYYGAGWRSIRYFIELTSASLKDDVRIFDKISADWFKVKPEYLTECFDRAIAAAKDDVTRRHCEVSALQVECLLAGDNLSIELRQKLLDAGVKRISEGKALTLTDEE